MGRTLGEVDVSNSPLQLSHIEVRFASIPHESRMRAIPAVGCTKIRDEKKNPVRISVDQTWHWTVAFFR